MGSEDAGAGACEASKGDEENDDDFAANGLANGVAYGDEREACTESHKANQSPASMNLGTAKVHCRVQVLDRAEVEDMDLVGRSLGSEVGLDLERTVHVHVRNLQCVQRTLRYKLAVAKVVYQT